jgi:hypothetical protein
LRDLRFWNYDLRAGGAEEMLVERLAGLGKVSCRAAGRS